MFALNLLAPNQKKVCNVYAWVQKPYLLASQNRCRHSSPKPPRGSKGTENANCAPVQAAEPQAFDRWAGRPRGADRWNTANPA